MNETNATIGRPIVRFVPLRTPGERPTFRADIEGLRGVAVLLVVLYHAGVPGFSGGYIGVDVFFALSGYLITGILAAEIESTGRLDLARFYARRARRLLPAVGVLLLAVGAFAFTFYSPLEQESIAQTALATAAYVSNFFFAAGATDYLAADAETNPLLHTWSLSVEEQFYLGWPLLVLVGLAGVRKVRLSHRRLVLVMVGVTALSFALSLYLMGSLRTHWAFFASPPRAWEFALGGLGALLPRVRLGSGRGGARTLGWLGLGAVVASGALYTARTPFPGWAALIPVVGTVVVLRAGVGKVAPVLERVLGWRPLREAGRLSYSWYLWHWPVLVFAVGLYGEVSLPVRLALVVGSLGLAELSYRLVEDPIRHHRGLARRPAYGLALLAAITAGGVGLSLVWNANATAAAGAPDQATFAAAVEDRDDGQYCITTVSGTDLTDCTYGDAAAPRTLVLYGDSHAFHWLPAVAVVGEQDGWRVETVMKSSCGAVGVTRWNDRLGRPYYECDEWRDKALDRVAQLQPDLVVVSSAVTAYDGIDRAEWSNATASVLERLAAVSEHVVVLRDVPAPGFDVPSCLSRAAWRGGAPGASCDFEAPPAAADDVFAAQIAAADRFENVSVADPVPAVCPGGECRAFQDGVVGWRDASHLSATHARDLAPEVYEVVAAASARTDGLRGTPVTSSGL